MKHAYLGYVIENHGGEWRAFKDDQWVARALTKRGLCHYLKRVRPDAGSPVVFVGRGPSRTSLRGRAP